MKNWNTRKADNGKVYVHLRKAQVGAGKTLQEHWGIRFDLDTQAKAI
jgi:hypothetical protein